MPQILIEDVISADRSELFNLTQDYKHRLKWDSFAKRVRYDKGFVTSYRGVANALSWFNPLRMTVEHINLIAPSLAATSMLKGPFFFLMFSGSWYFRSLKQNRTEVAINYQFKSRWRVFGFIFDPLIILLLERDCRRALQDLKFAAEETDLLDQIRIAN